MTPPEGPDTSDSTLLIRGIVTPAMAAGSRMAGQIAMLVVDASVAVKFVTEEPGSEAAYQIVVGRARLAARGSSERDVEQGQAIPAS